MSKPLRTGLLALSLLALGVPPYTSAAQTTLVTATETSPAEPQAAATDSQDSETDRGWIGLLPLLGAAAIMALAITVVVNLLRRRR